MQEGALIYWILTGDEALVAPARREAETLLINVKKDGTITSLPDAYGTSGYEYGEALSALGLAAVAFRGYDQSLSERSLAAGLAVAAWVSMVHAAMHGGRRHAAGRAESDRLANFQTAPTRVDC
jgi:hypothetical protein